MKQHRDWKQNQSLTPKELESYRRWLSELDEEARQSGSDLSRIDKELWQYFNPKTVLGEQIYKSYSDEELLTFVLATMNHPGHKPVLNEIYCVYLRYLKIRFGGLDKVIALAKTRRKQLEEEARWPADWTERVSPAPLFAHCEQRGCPLDEAEKERLQKFCETVIMRGSPPAEAELSPNIKALFRRACGSWQKGLKIMNIPVLNKRALKHLKQYWTQERAKKEANQ